jgi:hypothetical protein
MLTVACQATSFPGAGDWAATVRHVAFELPGPLVEKYSASRRMIA